MIDTSKVIHAPVGGGRYTVTAPIIKEDYGLYLKIEGLELPATYEVDFSNSEHNGTSVTMIGNSDGVLIPHQFIDTGKDVFAFLYHVGADFGRTVYKFRIPNKLRPDRTDETPTPEEQSTIDQCISALNSAVEQTAQDVIDADASAQNASADAERAEEARTDAQNYAIQAEQSATDAHKYASQASASATASANSAEASARCSADAQDSAEEAQGYAQSASQSATASATSASQASASATSASQSVTSAQGYASQAQTSASTASSKASEASTSAQTASTKASEASGYATTASNKATEASGYATSASQAKTDAESAKDLAQGYASDAQGYANDAQASAESVSASASQIAQNTSDIASLEADIYKPYATDTASGAIASFTDGADDIPLKSLVVDINPVQDLHGYDSPWIGGGGLNKVPLFESETVNGVTLTNNNGEITLNGTATADAYFNLDVNILVPSGSTFYLCCFNPVATDSRVSLFAITDNGNPQKNMNTVNGMTTTTATADTIISKFRLRAPIGVTLTDFKCSPMLQIGGTAPTVFSPYENICHISGWAQVDVNRSGADMTNPTTVTIQLGQTVYGAKLYPLEGKALINMAMVDLGTIDNWRYNQGKTGAFDTIVALTPLAKSNTKCICSQYKTLAYPNQGNITNSDFCVGINKKDDGTTYTGAYVVGTLVVKDSRYSDVDAFRTAMNGVMLCYELAEPIEIQLTPQQVKVNSLYGVNNIWADSGDTEVEYRADTKLYIERLTAPDSADMIADANITSGKYFMVGNSLYKATANIASGSAVIVGTNAIRKSLSEALNEINS